jgi:hypothetical protein
LLGTTNAFGYIVAVVLNFGMNVIAGTDSHACHKEAHDTHPNWIAVDEYGNKRSHPSDP